MKNKQLISERKQFMKLAGLLKEDIGYGGVDTVPSFEFELDGQEYIADLTVSFRFERDTEEGMDNYSQSVEIDELAKAQGDEYIPVTDRNEIAKVEQELNTNSALSKQIENSIDVSKAERGEEDYYDDLEEDSDYDMGTPSGDTNAMGDTDAMSIGEANKMYSYSHINDIKDALYLIDDLIEYMADRADSDDEGGMNKEGNLRSDLEDLKSMLIGLQRGKK